MKKFMEVQCHEIIKDNELRVIKIEDLEKEDFNKYYEIIISNFTLPNLGNLELGLFKVYFKDKNCSLYFYKNTETDEIIGVCMIQEKYNDIEYLAYLSDFCINKDYRNKGNGKDFLIKIIEKLKDKENIKLYLDVETTNDVAIKLYTNNGFIIEKKIESEFCEDYYILSYLLQPKKEFLLILNNFFDKFIYEITNNRSLKRYVKKMCLIR